jgi:tetratricopeptide (TPR) repeat protein
MLSSNSSSSLDSNTSPNKQNPQNILNYGLTLFNDGDGDFFAAGKVLEEAARNNVEEPGEFWYALGMCRYALWEKTWDNFVDEDGDGIDDRLEEVVGAYRRCLAFPEMLKQPRIFFATGQAYENYGSFEGAIQMYSHIISGFPNYEKLSTVILKAAAICRHPRINKLDEATKYFEYLLDNPPPPYKSNRIAFILAGCYQRQGRNHLARDMLSDVLKKVYDEKKNESKRMKSTSPGDDLLISRGLKIPPTTASTSTRIKVPTLQVWMSDPNMWRERAQFHFNAGIFTLAVDAMSQTLRLNNNSQLHEASNTPEWEDWELLAISLRRINEKESALKALERAFNMNPYTQPIRLRQRIARWDPIDWRLIIQRQEIASTRITSFFRGRVGARSGKIQMQQERIRRKIRNNAAKTIQYAWKFQLFRRNFKRQRELIAKSLGRIAKRCLQSTFDSWNDFVDLVQYHRKNRNNKALSIQLWFTYEKSRFKRKCRRAYRRRAIAKSLEQMRTKIKRAVVKAWEGYVIWIIDVKEPYNATTIQCWYKHIKWSEEFYRKRALMLKSLNNIRLNFMRRLFHHFIQVVKYQILARNSRRIRRPYDRYKKCFLSWKHRALEFRPWWIKTKQERKKERYYEVKRAAFRLVDSNSLRIDPRNPFSILGLASVGVAQKSDLINQVDTNTTEEKLKRMNRNPGIVRQLSRSLQMYEKVCRLWREYYANREESQGVSFMHSRLPKDTFDRAHLGSIYYKGIVQTALIKQELDRFRLTKIPLHPKLRKIMPGKINKKPKTTLGTLFDKEKERKEAHFVKIHLKLLDEIGIGIGRKRIKPQSLGTMALTLPNSLRKQVHNFQMPGKMWNKKMKRLTGKNLPISLSNLVPPLKKKEEIYVDRREDDETSNSNKEQDDDEDEISMTDEFGNDNPDAILKHIIESVGGSVSNQPIQLVGPEVTNRHAWGFPEYKSPGVYGIEGLERAKNEAEYDIRIANGEWSRMAREEIEQREIDAILLRRSREDDYNRFARATNVCGPMSDMDFFCALRPGRLYEQRVYVSACRIQLWALIWVPRRYSNRLEASIHIQRMGRGRIARKLLWTKLTIKNNIYKILNRLRNACFYQWKKIWYNKLLVSKMLLKLLNKNLNKCFMKWVQYIDNVHKLRLKKLENIYQKMKNSKLSRHFVKWYEYIPLARKIRRLMWKVMASHKLYLFDTWATNVENIILDRLELKSSIIIQKIYRGYISRIHTKIKYQKYTVLACIFQRIVRGHIGRVKYKLYRKRRRDIEIRQARERKIRKLRGSYNDQLVKEKQRRFVEQMFVEDVARSNNIQSNLKMRTTLKLVKRKNIQNLIQSIKKFYKNNSTQLESVLLKNDYHNSYEWVGTLPVPLKYMEWPILKKKKLYVMAERWITSVQRSEDAFVSLNKFRSNKPPPFSCEQCKETFVNDRDYQSHVHCHADRSQWIYTPESYYEYGLAESGGSIKGKIRERRMSSITLSRSLKKVKKTF